MSPVVTTVLKNKKEKQICRHSNNHLLEEKGGARSRNFVPITHTSDNVQYNAAVCVLAVPYNLIIFANFNEALMWLKIKPTRLVLV